MSAGGQARSPCRDGEGEQTLIGSECRVDATDHSGVCPSRDPCTSGRESAPYAAASTTTSAATTTPSPTAWGTL